MTEELTHFKIKFKIYQKEKNMVIMSRLLRKCEFVSGIPQPER